MVIQICSLTKKRFSISGSHSIPHYKVAWIPVTIIISASLVPVPQASMPTNSGEGDTGGLPAIPGGDIAQCFQIMRDLMEALQHLQDTQAAIAEVLASNRTGESMDTTAGMPGGNGNT